MAQTGYTPLLIYASGTASNVPLAANLTSSASGAELALNYADGRLFYKDSGGVVQVLATKGTGAIGGSNTQVQYNSSGSLAGSANLTFDGTNLGIGASSPGAKLDIGGTNNTVFFKNSGATTGYALATVSNTSGAFQYGISSSTGTFWGSGNAGNYSANIGTTSATNLGFGTSDTLRMLLDSSGNLGLGVTPSAWSSGSGRAIEIGPSATGFLFNDSNNTNLGSNAYFNAGWKYQTSSVGASRYAQSSGGHSWFIAPSGTAGNAITFTTAMTLDGSGNLGVGTTTFSYVVAGRGLIEVNGSSSALIAIKTGDTARGYFAASTTITELAAEGASQPLVFTTNAAERARITTGGEVYIAGTTDQGAYNLQVNGTGVWGAGAYVNGSDERLKEDIATIDAALDVVTSLRPVTFRYKEAYSKDQSIQPGFIAQELQAAMAGKSYLGGIVQEGPQHLNVAYQSLIPLLTKAIQEQQAIIEQLKADVAALKGA
jgi:hypothetical protein